jgi:hypothetical protein
MSNEAKEPTASASDPDTASISEPGPPAGKARRKNREGPGEKNLHVEIGRGNWKRLKSHMDTYNKDPARMTPRINVGDVLNRALAELLGGKGKGA